MSTTIVTLADTIKAIQAIMATVPGIKSAPAQPQENNQAAVYAHAYRGPSDWPNVKPGFPDEAHRSIIVEVKTARQNLPEDDARIGVYEDLVPRRLRQEFDDNQWQHTAAGYDNIRCEELEWPEPKELGYRFTITGILVWGE